MSDHSVTLHARGGVDGVAEQTVLGHLLADHASHHASRVNTYQHSECDYRVVRQSSSDSVRIPVA